MKRHSLGMIPFRRAPDLGLVLPFETRSGLSLAQVSGVPEFDSARPFPRERWPELAGFGPNVLIGYGLDLKRLAEKTTNGEIELTSVDHAIFALTDCGLSPIGDPLRSLLWRSFGVPVYELIVAPGCRLLACECEAHDGWHLAPSINAYLVKRELFYDAPPLTNLDTGFTAEIDSDPCACGRPASRLKNLAPHLPRPNEQRLAAIG